MVPVPVSVASGMGAGTWQQRELLKTHSKCRLCNLVYAMHTSPRCSMCGLGSGCDAALLTRLLVVKANPLTLGLKQVPQHSATQTKPILSENEQTHDCHNDAKTTVAMLLLP